MVGATSVMQYAHIFLQNKSGISFFFFFTEMSINMLKYIVFISVVCV